jgi:hypothetical protein
MKEWHFWNEGQVFTCENERTMRQKCWENSATQYHRQWGNCAAVDMFQCIKVQIQLNPPLTICLLNMHLLKIWFVLDLLECNYCASEESLYIAHYLQGYNNTEDTAWLTLSWLYSCMIKYWKTAHFQNSLISHHFKTCFTVHIWSIWTA